MLGTLVANRYAILEELGRGGMGVVYRAHDPVLNRDVALKLVPAGSLMEDLEARFRREAHVVAQMDHPAIVSVYDLGRDEPTQSLFFVMPVVRGETLRNRLATCLMSLGEALDIVVQTADALEYSHAHGVIHRDIKPENLMVTTGPGGVRVRVMDFGLAKQPGDGRGPTQSGEVVGTLAYASPEQLGGEPLDGRTDIYSLGMVLYECLVGEPAFAGDPRAIMFQVLRDAPSSPLQLGVPIDAALDRVVMRCLEKDPAHRPQRAGELAEELRRCATKLHDSGRRTLVASAPTSVRPRRVADLPFVGRATEFAELRHRLNMAQAGECHLAVVAGDVGVGKTRLLQELATLARARRVMVLSGRFAELDIRFPYQGYCDLIQDYFRGGESSERRVELRDLAPDLVSVFPILSEIQEIRAASPTGDLRSAAVRPPEDRTAIYELLARTLARLSGGRPLVLILENLHQADVSVEALQYIFRRLGSTPTLVAGSYRTDLVDRKHPLVKAFEAFRGDPRFAHLVLRAFSEADHRELVVSTLDGDAVSDELARRLFETSEGNPFFTKELVRSLRETNGMTRDATGAWTLSGSGRVRETALPETIQQAIEMRIQRLDAPLRDLLGVASVLGRSFDLRDLEALSGNADLDDAADRLLDEGLLEEENESRGKRLSFTSSLVRDVLYTGLPRRKRKTLHRTFAEHLESRHAGRLDRVLAALLFHYAEADVAAKAVPYALLSARKALETASLEDALRAARTALDFLVDVGREGDATQEIEARLLLAGTLRATGDLDGALEEGEKVVSVCGDDPRHAPRKVEALVQLAETSWEALRTEEARRHAAAGIAAARAAGDSGGLARVLSLGATLASLRGEPETARAYVEERERLEAERRVADEEPPPRGGRLVVALAGPIAATDPASIQTLEEVEVAACCWETLATADAAGHVLPDLCERIESEEGGARFVLTLRPGITFHDGVPLTAARVKESIERTLRLRPTSPPPAFAILARDESGSPDVRVLSDATLELRLASRAPNYAALLTDIHTAVVRESRSAAGALSLVGTGPFRLGQAEAGRWVVLDRFDSWWRGTPALLDAVEFRPHLGAEAIAAGLRAGEIDVARDLFPEDLEEVLRDPRLRAGLREAPRKATYFIVFDGKGALGGNGALREALAGVIDTHALVWRTLGRFAQPAAGLIPPGILGHDAGRRRPAFRPEEARERLRAAGLSLPVELRVALHPIFQERFRTFTSALFALWSDLGARVTVVTPTLDAYLASFSDGGADALIGRWSADYGDPDNFTYDLFHSRHGELRAWYGSAETDRLLEEARMQGQPGVREELVRRFEDQIIGAHVLTPLFHDLGYRIAGPKVSNMRLGSHPPFVNYHQVAKSSAPGSGAAPAPRHGVVHVPMAGDVISLNPTLSDTVEADEVIGNVVEPLMRVTEGAQIVPWLAREVRAENGGRRFRFLLREEVRFHDGRRLSARDVRHTFEKLARSPSQGISWVMSRICGAKELAEGTSSELAGLTIVSPGELTIDLVEPLVIFPTLLTHAATGIVPEGSDGDATSWKGGYVGTGPFRLRSYEPGRRVELEANPAYWRSGLPRSDGLVFHLKTPLAEISSGLRTGRFALASDLRPEQAEALCRDPVFGPRRHQKPLLCTYMLVLNSHRGPLSDRAARRELLAGIDVAGLVGRHLGRVAVPARTLIPPGILPRRRMELTPAPAVLADVAPMAGARLRAAVHPIFLGDGEYAPLAKELFGTLKARGVEVALPGLTIGEYMDAHATGEGDVLLGRWVGDYPDPDTFASILHTRSGFLGRYCGSAEIDALIEQGGKEPDAAVRRSLYLRLEERIREEALLLPLFHEQLYRFVRPEVRGLELTFTSPNVRYELLALDG